MPNLDHPALWAAAALMLAYGLVWTWRVSPDASHLRSAIKTGSVACLVLWGVAIGGPVLALVGAGFGALGDWFLSRPGERAFLAGMAAFGIGHLAYAAMFLAAPGGLGDGPGWVVTLAVVAVGLSTEVWLARHTGALLWPVRAYVALICLMLWAALGLSPGLAVAGAVLFVVSDLLLAVATFVARRPRPRAALSVALWPVYWSGQAAILAGSPALG